MKYRHTHYSVHDGSPAMLVFRHSSTEVVLMNEDGFQWTAPADEWVSYDEIDWATLYPEPVPETTCPPIPDILEPDDSAGRWCEHCGKHTSHHTDRHAEFAGFHNPENDAPK